MGDPASLPNHHSFGHYLLSFHGRLARRRGEYDRAIAAFTEAVSLYERRGGHHNQARTLANLAFAKTLQARRIDDTVQKNVRGKLLAQRPERLRKEAQHDLARAEAVLRERGLDKDLGAVYNIRAFSTTTAASSARRLH